MPFLASASSTIRPATWAVPGSGRGSAARLVVVLTALVALGALVVTLGGSPATAAPAPLGYAPGDIDEGGTDDLREQLEKASKGYVDAKTKLDRSVKRQKELTEQLGTLRTEVTARSQQVAEMAGVAYRTGRLGQVSALLSSGSPASLLDRAAALDKVAANENRALRDLRATLDAETEAKAELDREIREQRKQVEVMETRKKQAERALAAANSGGASGGVSGGNSASARPAPRNSDGSWPAESCSVNDPTPADGCITPRTLHALNQAKAAGFTRYVSCFRSGGSGEHPKGRACDFAAQKNGFGGVATGGDRTYGNNLAAYFVKNADRLGVLYVIWFKQIWLPSSGWRAYNGGGDPSSDHTNHVHLSMN
ncbi:coiled-coil domain-containing protein [Plantactinospora sonchi]|uniref:ARB-07466-like C-terminal domain-containing protein n=1 Tax=Plantactinospora sonchi TaxID=1544735 RepID=A0ABU7S0J1_9ACTN